MVSASKLRVSRAKSAAASRLRPASLRTSPGSFSQLLHLACVRALAAGRECGERRPPVAERVQHPLQLDHVRPFHARERAIAEPALRRVVDALHLADGLGVLADFDRQRDVVAAAAGIVGVGDLDRGRLQVAPAAVAALRLPGLEREDHPLGERHAGALGGLERRRRPPRRLRARP